MNLVLKNIKEMKTFAEKTEKEVMKFPAKRAKVIGLVGELGAGKTTFTQFFAQALGIKENISSPTFVIEKIYKIKSKREFTHLIHIDAYRLNTSEELVHLGWKDILENPKNIILIEWADKVEKILPEGYVKINIEHSGGDKREIFIETKDKK